MASYLNTSARIENPRFAGHVWRDKDGDIHGTVDVTEDGRTWLSFGSPEEARALAAACTACAEAMEAFPPAGEDGK